MAIFRNGIIAPFLMQANFGKLFFTESLSGEADVEGSREEGWSRFFEGENGLPLREGVTIEPGKCSDRVSVTYCTKRYANAGRFWFERIARHAATFIGREIHES